jgi:pimeloyl-ACP methyl ester carboxylesterase
LSEPQTIRLKGAGVDIAADLAGPADGVPVILLHGGGQTRASWGGAVQEGARRGYRMINLDLRGHGDSGWAADGDYSLDALVADLSAVVTTLDAPPFLVGASMGGIAVLAYAGEGGAPRGVVLVDIAPRLEQKGADRIRGFMNSAPDGFGSLEEAADAVSAYLPHRPRPADTSGLAKNLRQGADGRFRWHWDPEVLSRHRTPRDENRLLAAARNLHMPSLLVRGRMSDIVSPEGAQEFLELAPRGEFVDIPGADHMVAGDRNDAFNAAVFAFLDKNAQDPSGQLPTTAKD